VRGFSKDRIAHARFVRLAIELEVIWHACAVWTDREADILERNMEQQQQAIETDQLDTFHSLDQKFHKLICELGGCPMAVTTIEDCKQKVESVRPRFCLKTTVSLQTLSKPDLYKRRLESSANTWAALTRQLLRFNKHIRSTLSETSPRR